MRERLHKRFMLAGKQLGLLELKVLEHFESRRNATVSELMDEGIFDQKYTTIATTLIRLCKKGLLKRIPDKGRAFRYSLIGSVREMYWKDASEQLTRLLSDDNGQTLILSLLVDVCGKDDPALLDQLDALIKQKRIVMRKPST